MSPEPTSNRGPAGSGVPGDGRSDNEQSKAWAYILHSALASADVVTIASGSNDTVTLTMNHASAAALLNLVPHAPTPRPVSPGDPERAEVEVLRGENERLKKALGEVTESVRRWKNRAGSQRRKAKRRLAVLRAHGIEDPGAGSPPEGVVVTTDGRYFADLQTSGMPDGWRFVHDAQVRYWVEISPGAGLGAYERWKADVAALAKDLRTIADVRRSGSSGSGDPT